MITAEEVPVYSPAEIRSLRIEVGLSIERFGILFGVGHTSIQNWESGKSAPSKIHNFRIHAVKILWNLQQKNFLAELEKLKKIKREEFCETVRTVKLGNVQNLIVFQYVRHRNRHSSN